MYSVIIIDDEPKMIKGIRNAFDWNKYGFEIIGEFTSAHKAFDFICEKSPDLVLTDIRMPEISGLELLKRTKEKGMDVEFVIVSGFAEFVYAQEALRYGALDYCLKPIDIGRVDQLIEKLALHFSKKRNVKNNMLLEALTSNDKTELENLTHFFHNSSDYFFRVLTVYSHSERKDYNDIKFFQVKDALQVEFGARKTLYILKSQQKIDLDNLIDSSILKVSDIKAVGMSSISYNYENIAKLIKQADIAASKIFLNEEKGIFIYEQKLNMVKPLIDKNSSIIKDKKFEEMGGLIERHMKFFKQNDFGMGEVVYLWNQTVSVLVGTYYEELRYMELDFLNYSELKERFENFESLCSFLNEIYLYIKQMNSQAIDDGDINSYFSNMIKYIESNYQDELYLKDLSAKFFINQVYCCKLFKSLLGKTFSEYVTELRIKKACEMLKSTDLSIDQVATKVGYVDYYYFNKVFKKQCGITPAKYRKS